MSRRFQVKAGNVVLTVDAIYQRGNPPSFEIRSITCGDDISGVIDGNVMTTVEEKLAEYALEEAAECRAEQRDPEHA